MNLISFISIFVLAFTMVTFCPLLRINPTSHIRCSPHQIELSFKVSHRVSSHQSNSPIVHIITSFKSNSVLILDHQWLGSLRGINAFINRLRVCLPERKSRRRPTGGSKLSTAGKMTFTFFHKQVPDSPRRSIYFNHDWHCLTLLVCVSQYIQMKTGAATEQTTS